MSFLYKSEPVRGELWRSQFARQMPECPFRIWPDLGDGTQIRYMAAWMLPDDIPGLLPNLEVVFSTGAGIDQFDFSRIPAHVPVVRLIEPDLSAGIVEYVVHGVITAHRDMIDYRNQQLAGVWQSHRNKLARDVRVGVMGLGVLGQATLRQLVQFGYACAGWSRSGVDLPGVERYAGEANLSAFLARSDILICLLPLTDNTRGVLNAQLFDRLPKGASLINVGRGGHLVQDDLLAALASGHLANAILDVADPEPLPAEHPFWSHERIVVTPHIASMASAESAVQVILDNIRRHEAGQAMIGLVDRTRGY